MHDFEAVWRSIAAFQGQTFRLKRGQPFQYVVSGNNVVPTTTNRQLGRSQFARAFQRLPVQGPAELNDLQGPSYLFAILTDPRIAGEMTSAQAAPAINGSGHGQAGREAAAGPSGLAEAPPERPLAPDALLRIDRRRALLVVPACAEKALGGEPSGRPAHWCSQALRQGRESILAAIPSDLSRVLPAWQRYMGGFYQHAGSALADAVVDGNVVIISGGYGIVPATEPIGWYDRALHRSDWPAGVLEGALFGEARRADAEVVVAFAPAASELTDLVRAVPWHTAGVTAYLVTAHDAGPEDARNLGLAFKAIWNGDERGYPESVTAERIA